MRSITLRMQCMVLLLGRIARIPPLLSSRRQLLLRLRGRGQLPTVVQAIRLDGPRLPRITLWCAQLRTVFVLVLLLLVLLLQGFCTFVFMLRILQVLRGLSQLVSRR